MCKNRKAVDTMLLILEKDFEFSVEERIEALLLALRALEYDDVFDKDKLDSICEELAE